MTERDDLLAISPFNFCSGVGILSFLIHFESMLGLFFFLLSCIRFCCKHATVQTNQHLMPHWQVSLPSIYFKSITHRCFLFFFEFSKKISLSSKQCCRNTICLLFNVIGTYGFPPGPDFKIIVVTLDSHLCKAAMDVPRINFQKFSQLLVCIS